MLDITDKLVTNAKLIRDGVSWHTARKHGAHLGDLAIGDAPGRTGMTCASALIPIGVVVKECAEFKVGRIATQLHIAAVADASPIGDRAVVYLVAKPMRGNLFACSTCATNANDAIPTAFGAAPEPTGIRSTNSDARPKAARQGCAPCSVKASAGTIDRTARAVGEGRRTGRANSCYSGHCQTPNSLAVPRASQALRGFGMPYFTMKGRST